MSKNSGSLELAGIIAFLVLVGLIAFIVPQIVLAIFAPVAGYFIWRDHDKIAKLEKQLAAQKPSENAGQA